MSGTHHVPKAEVISEEDPGAGLPPPGGHLSPSVRDAVLDKNLDLLVLVGTLREILRRISTIDESDLSTTNEHHARGSDPEEYANI